MHGVERLRRLIASEYLNRICYRASPLLATEFYRRRNHRWMTESHVTNLHVAPHPTVMKLLMRLYLIVSFGLILRPLLTWFGLVVTGYVWRRSTEPLHADFHASPRNLMLAAEKNAELPVFALSFISNSRFFGLLFNFTIYKTKSSRCKLTFMIIIVTNFWRYFHH